MFIVCGVLYAIESVSAKDTKIRFAMDLYHKKILEPALTFTNPFRKTTSVGYNHRFKVKFRRLKFPIKKINFPQYQQELYTWDKGNQLTYPIRYHELGYNHNATESDDVNPQLNTGYDVFRHNN